MGFQDTQALFFRTSRPNTAFANNKSFPQKPSIAPERIQSCFWIESNNPLPNRQNSVPSENTKLIAKKFIPISRPVAPSTSQAVYKIPRENPIPSPTPCVLQTEPMSNKGDWIYWLVNFPSLSARMIESNSTLKEENPLLAHYHRLPPKQWFNFHCPPNDIQPLTELRQTP